jgi:hypothetical protein
MAKLKSVVPLLGLALLAGGCGNDFDPPSEVRGLRVLAVRADPASGVPGERVRLEMLRADAKREAGEPERAVEVAWFGGCHAPPSRQFFDCYPLLTQISRLLEPRVLDTPMDRFPPGIFATGEQFEFEVPADVLERSPRIDSDPIHFAPSYLFFAACAGRLVPRPELTDRVPLSCVSPDSGEPVGKDDFVIGFSTLFSFEGASNENPVLESLRFGGSVVPELACSTDADCQGAATDFSESLGCSRSGRCAPVVLPCGGDDCERTPIAALVGGDSAEPLPGEDRAEVIWVNYYANAGQLGVASRLAHDRTSGWIADYGTRWKPPPVAGEITIWATVHDQRGGAAWSSLDVLVRD